MAQLVLRHSCVVDRLPVVVRFPAGPRVSLKSGDQSGTPARSKDCSHGIRTTVFFSVDDISTQWKSEVPLLKIAPNLFVLQVHSRRRHSENVLHISLPTALSSTDLFFLDGAICLSAVPQRGLED